MTRYEVWCHPWPDHHPTTGAASSLPSPHTHLAAACFPSTCGKHLHRWSLSPPSFSLSPPPLIYSHPSILSPYVFLFLRRKREVLIVNMERCQRQKKTGPCISGSKLRGLPKHIFIMKSQHGMGRPCAAAGLICSKHVQIGRPTQTIKVEWRFCSTRHFCLTRGSGTPSKEQTHHKRKEKTQAHWLDSLKYSRITQKRADYCCWCYSTSKQCFKHCLLTPILLLTEQLKVLVLQLTINFTVD